MKKLLEEFCFKNFVVPLRGVFTQDFNLCLCPVWLTKARFSLFCERKFSLEVF